MNRIDGIRLKIERAKKHIRDLDHRIEIFGESKPYTIGAKPHTVPEIKHTTLYVASVSTIPDDFALIIGDAIHNLRSSLDHLVWQLVEAGGGTPNERTAFPICFGAKGPQQYASAIGSGEIKAMPPDAEKALRAIQPYVTSDDTLWHLHDLDRIDKHRLIIAVGTALLDWHVSVSEDLTIPFPTTPRHLIAGYEIVNIPTATYERTGHQNFKLGIDIAFGESEIVAGKPVLETVNYMAQFVGSIVASFECFL